MLRQMHGPHAGRLHHYGEDRRGQAPKVNSLPDVEISLQTLIRFRCEICYVTEEILPC